MAKTSKIDPDRDVKNAAMALKMAGDHTRLKIMFYIGDGEKNVGEIVRHLGANQPATSHHLGLMRLGGFVSSRRCGKNNFYALTERGRILSEAAKGAY